MADAAKAQEANSGETEVSNTAAQTAAGNQQNAQADQDFDALPAWAKQTIKDLRKEQQLRRKQVEEQEAANKAAEDKQLAERQEWQKLAESRAAKLTDLEPIAERYAALSGEITAQIEAEIKAWPAEVQALRPADADAVTLMAWAKTARPLAQKLTQAAQPPAPGQGQPPRPAGQTDRTDAERQKAALAQARSRF